MSRNATPSSALTGLANNGRARFGWSELGGAFALVGLTILFLAFSWRRWPDPLIDFGRELYTPWRLANGAVLYRDVDAFYGPLSQYFNAALFALFKPGLMVLVAANLTVFGAIVTALYFLCRQAWGVRAALAASTVFIVLFGFSQFVSIGNYNYATPYAHEVTHGLFLCLVLTLTLLRWMRQATPFRSFLAGTLLGLTALLKVEILFPAVVVTGVAAFAACRYWRCPSAAATLAWAGGAFLPTAAFCGYFAAFFPVREALSATCRAWLAVVGTTRFASDSQQIWFLGLDQPWKNFEQQMLATLAACVLIGAIAGVAWLTERIRHGWLAILLGTATAGAMGILAYFVVDWSQIGRCLFGLVLLYFLASAVTVFRRKEADENCRAEIPRQLIAALALAMMARMILNGRIYQYGFSQAALAAVVVTAALIDEPSRRFCLGRKGQATLLAGIFALLFPGVVTLANQSVTNLRAKTLEVGEGRDCFYAFPEQLDPTGKIVNVISEALRQESDARTLLTLPEGVMINYLARLPSTIAPVVFYAAATEVGREEEIVVQLNHRPPDVVVIVSRDLRDYGIQRYGERPGSGELILSWVAQNYTQTAHVGGDPLDYRDRGAVILKRK